MSNLKRVVTLPKKSEYRIRQMIHRGILKKYVEDNYVCYDVNEFIEYQKHPLKRGRPIKM